MASKTPLLTIRRTGALLIGSCLASAVTLTVGFLATLLDIRPEPAAKQRAAPSLRDSATLAVCDRDSAICVRCERMRVDGDRRIYDGHVEIQIDPLRFSCQHAERISRVGRAKRAPPEDLLGSGGVAIRGVGGFEDGITADRFRLPADGSGLLLAGDVRLAGAAGSHKYRLCTVTPSGRITGAVSLLDDLARSKGIDRKLGLVDIIASVYSDAELPPEASYLLALKLLERNMTWHAAYEPPRGKTKEASEPPPQDSFPWRVAIAEDLLRLDLWRWDEAHPGEAWMHVGPQGSEFWRFRDRRHVDVSRAVKLLEKPVEDTGQALRRQRWLLEIDRNNTMLRMQVRRDYSPGPAAAVLIDVRSADELSLKLYRAAGPRVWPAVALPVAIDFIYCDRDPQRGFVGSFPLGLTLDAIPADAWWNAGRRRGLRDLSGCWEPSYERRTLALPELLDAEDLVYQWRVAAADLEHVALSRPERPYVPGSRPSAWQCDRLLEIPAKILQKPGRFVLAVEANGQTAYAPLAVGSAPQ